MPVGVALIGSARRDLLSLKAIYSRTSRSAQALASDIDVYGDDAGEGRSYEDLLNRDDVQNVIIALPIVVQPEYIRKALQAGKHVLSEKPIAKDLGTARELLDWYHDGGNKLGGTWSVAENFRFLDSFLYAAQRISSLGRVLSFNVRIATFKTDPPETPWRKTPSHQGGFLLDGGVHFTAGIRLLLGETYIQTLSAHTAQLQAHLPPVDTVDATMKTNTGVTGSFSVSFGTTLPDVFEYCVGCKGGSVTVREGVVVMRREGEESREFPDEGEGVRQEVEAWAEGGKSRRQCPEEALADLEMLEAMLRSGESGGEPVRLELQEVRGR
ncbi:MAG: hypothetical protein Q9195_006112 [Heterodermia aff. obscurata]